MKKLILIMGIFSALFGCKEKGQSTDENYKPVLKDLTAEPTELINVKSKEGKGL